MRIRLLSMLMVMSGVRLAVPPISKEQGTSFLKDADSYIGKAPLIPTVSRDASPKRVKAPTPTRQSSPVNTPMRVPSPESLEDTDAVPLQRKYPAAVIHRSTITVGQQIPVPAEYAAPQVIQNGGLTVVPATPTSFMTIQTGTTMSAHSSGDATVRDTELSGFVNYGSPIRTVVPAYNQQGQQTGSQIITVTPNPIVIPVTSTIERK